MKLQNVPAETGEKICILEMKRRNNSPEYIEKSIESGFRRNDNRPTKLSEYVIYKNTYYSEVLISLNILDMSSAPYWMVKYLENLGYECPILFSYEND
jgi:hypothetical protein